VQDLTLTLTPPPQDALQGVLTVDHGLQWKMIISIAALELFFFLFVNFLNNPHTGVVF
jgi:hypothetical protein